MEGITEFKKYCFEKNPKKPFKIAIINEWVHWVTGYWQRAKLLRLLANCKVKYCI